MNGLRLNDRHVVLDIREVAINGDMYRVETQWVAALCEFVFFVDRVRPGSITLQVENYSYIDSSLRPAGTSRTVLAFNEHVYYCAMQCKHVNSTDCSVHHSAAPGLTRLALELSRVLKLRGESCHMRERDLYECGGPFQRRGKLRSLPKTQVYCRYGKRDK